MAEEQQGNTKYQLFSSSKVIVNTTFYVTDYVRKRPSGILRVPVPSKCESDILERV